MRPGIFAVVALTLAGPAAAQSAGSRPTRDYVAAAAQSDAFETLEAETALTQSGDPQVRAYAQMMIADHGRTSAGLREATGRAGLEPPPPGLGADQAPLLAALQGLRGAEFDKTYWRQQALAHRAALTTTRIYASGGDSAPIRQAATAAMPVIAAHLATAERMAAAAGS